MPGFVMSPELKRAVQDMLRTYGNSFQPRPKRGRRLRRGGGGSTTGTTLREARVTVDIPAQILNDDGDGWAVPVTPGEAILVDTDGFDTGSAFVVTNRDDQFYTIDCRVWLDGTRVDHGSCWPVEWPVES